MWFDGRGKVPRGEQGCTAVDVFYCSTPWELVVCFGDIGLPILACSSVLGGIAVREAV